MTAGTKYALVRQNISPLLLEDNSDDVDIFQKEEMAVNLLSHVCGKYDQGSRATILFEDLQMKRLR